MAIKSYIFVITYFLCYIIFQINIYAEQAHNLLQLDSRRPPYLRLPIDGQIRTVDPAYVFEEATIEITEQLFLGLTGFAWDGTAYKVVPEIATHWTVSNHGKTYRFNIRKDIYWVKGITAERVRPVTAYDIKWAIQRNINPHIDAPYASSLYILKNAEKIHTGKIKNTSKIGVRVMNDYCIEFHLNNAAGYFPDLLTLWIFRPQPQEPIKLYGENWTKPENIWSNGPFYLDQWQKRRKLMMKKNPHYYDVKNITLPEVHYIIVPQAFAGLDMFYTGKIDLMGDGYLKIPQSQLDNILNNPSFDNVFHTGSRFASYSFFFNVKRPPLDNPLVRKAISYSINREMIVEVITKGNEKPATTFTPPEFLGCNKNCSEFGIEFNPDLAQKYLAEAGYPGGKNFPRIILMHNISELHANIAQAIQAFIEHYLNITVDIQEKEWSDYFKTIRQSDKNTAPHISQMGWNSDYLDANNWLCDAAQFFQTVTGWQNDEFDSLVEKGGEELDPIKRQKIYRKAEKLIVHDETSIMPIYFETAKYLINPCLKNWYPMPIGGQLVKDWSVKN
ncbi:MAG: peptide ABC transporter substrate-binding protein [Candidatus Magnetomorum sp.]|nr:peptide ABC transporter substrate-binding protein [Candidatus Magnetomorum sp.]